MSTSTPHEASPVAAPPPSDRAAKTEAKNAAVRATLEPLAAGERPPWVSYAAVLAALLGVLNIALYVAGVRVTGGKATLTGTVGVGVVLLACAIGMWRRSYSAVLAFELVLGVTAVFSGLSLVVVETVAGAARSLVVFLAASLFFYKLIRAMARLQMPQRPR